MDSPPSNPCVLPKQHSNQRRDRLQFASDGPNRADAADKIDYRHIRRSTKILRRLCVLSAVRVRWPEAPELRRVCWRASGSIVTPLFRRSSSFFVECVPCLLRRDVSDVAVQALGVLKVELEFPLFGGRFLSCEGECLNPTNKTSLPAMVSRSDCSVGPHGPERR